MSNILNIILRSPNKSYTNTSDGSKLEGVRRGEASVYCAQSDAIRAMMGNLQDTTVLSREACEETVKGLESGLIKGMTEVYDLDVPKEASGNFQDARTLGIPAVDALKPSKVKVQTNAVTTHKSKPKEPKTSIKR